MNITKLFFGLLIVVLSSVFTSSVVYADRIIHETSGKCVHPKGRPANPANNTPLVLYDADCKIADTRLDFHWEGNYIKHSSGKCVHPRGGSSTPRDDTPLVLHDGCNKASILFRQLASGHIKHTGSGKCIHPKGGAHNPGNNTPLVLHSSCTGERTQFEIAAIAPKLTHFTSNKKLYLSLSGKCVHPQGRESITREGTRLVIHSDDCDISSKNDDRLFFTMLPNGSIHHNHSGKCVVPVGRSSASIRDNTGLMLVDDCDSLATRFTHLPSKSLRHVSGKCIHPKGGSENPRDNTALVLYDSCDKYDLRFNFK